MAKSSRFHRSMKRRKELERQGKKKEKEERREALRKAAAEAKERGEEVFSSDQDLMKEMDAAEGVEPSGDDHADDEGPEDAEPEGDKAASP